MPGASVALEQLGVVLVAQPRLHLDALEGALRTLPYTAVPTGEFGGMPAAAPAAASSGRKRSARSGTRTTSSRCAVEIDTVAVMPGFSARSGFADLDDDVVGHHVLHRDRGVPHLHDGALEGAARIGVDGEGRRLPFVDAADVGLGDVRLHLHLGQVLGDLEELRRLEARGDGLSDVDAARDDDAVDRRRDVGVAERELRLGELRLHLLDGGLVERELGARLGVVAARGVEVVLGDQVARAQLLVALEAELA